jgi:hypothetical protein
MDVVMENVEVVVGESLLTPVEASRFLHIHPMTLNAWRCRGLGPPYIKLNIRNIRYSRRALERYLAEKTRAPEASTGAEAAAVSE